MTSAATAVPAADSARPARQASSRWRSTDERGSTAWIHVAHGSRRATPPTGERTSRLCTITHGEVPAGRMCILRGATGVRMQFAAPPRQSPPADERTRGTPRRADERHGVRLALPGPLPFRGLRLPTPPRNIPWPPPYFVLAQSECRRAQHHRPPARRRFSAATMSRCSSPTRAPAVISPTRSTPRRRKAPPPGAATGGVLGGAVGWAVGIGSPGHPRHQAVHRRRADRGGAQRRGDRRRGRQLGRHADRARHPPSSRPSATKARSATAAS